MRRSWFTGYLDFPNFISYGSLFFSILALLSTLLFNPLNFFLFIFLAYILDCFDGIASRKRDFGVERKEYGKYLDSFIDLTSYGFNPVLFYLTFSGISFTSFWVSFFFIAAIITRLSFYNLNTLQTKNGAHYYYGLPSPFILFPLFFDYLLETQLFKEFRGVGLPYIFLICAILSVINFPFPKPQGVYAKIYGIFLILIISLIVLLIYTL